MPLLWVSLLTIALGPIPDRPDPALAALSERTPGVIVTRSARTYPISGNDIGELRDRLRAQLNMDAAAGGHALTRSEIQVGYAFERSRGGCALIEAQVAVDVTTVLPSWEPDKPVPAALRLQWEQVRKALDTHEQGHADHALAASEELRQQLAQLPATAPSCRDIESAAQRILFRVMTRLKFRDQRYDMRTQYGSAQGAVL